MATRKPAPPPDEARASIATRDRPIPKWTNPKERIVFVRAGSIWIMKPDATDATQLTVHTHAEADGSPSLSPTGDALVYVTVKKGQHKIFLMNLSEMIPTALTDGGDDGDDEPTWSPDGKRIAFMRGDPRDKKDLYITGRKGGTPMMLLSGKDDEPRYAGTPSWSPDGKTIALSSDRRLGKGATLWLVDVRTGRLKQLTRPRPGASYIRDLYPSWSPDGTRLAFASNRHASSSDRADDYDLYSIAADGSGLVRLTDDPGVAVDPCYSPDGKRLYFSSNRGRAKSYEMELYVMPAVGGKQRRVTRDERPQNSAASVSITK